MPGSQLIVVVEEPPVSSTDFTPSFDAVMTKSPLISSPPLALITTFVITASPVSFKEIPPRGQMKGSSSELLPVIAIIGQTPASKYPASEKVIVESLPRHLPLMRKQRCYMG